MCEKCELIDIKITRYLRILADVDDGTVIALVNGFIADLESEKTRLHQTPDNHRRR
jgi:hypothetical protein